MLESSATKRDAKAYLQTFGSSIPKQKASESAIAAPHDGGIRTAKDIPRFVQGPETEATTTVTTAIDEIPHIAIVKLRETQSWDDNLLDGVAKTLTQLRDLGLLSVIVFDCGDQGPGWRETVAQQTDRILKAIGQHGSPSAELVDSSILKKSDACGTGHFASTSTGLYVGFGDVLTTPLKNGHIVVVPPRAYLDQTLGAVPADANEVVFALASYFAGLQFGDTTLGNGEQAVEDNHSAPLTTTRKAVVDRIIVIDPLGGIPSRKEGYGAQVFINLEDEFGDFQQRLSTSAEAGQIATASTNAKANHGGNLRLAKDALSILPSNASVVITSPAEAANYRGAPRTDDLHQNGGKLMGEVRTRRWQNPLIHNLLTDRPIYSSSLPMGRIKANQQQPGGETNGSGNGSTVVKPGMPTTTLAKRGTPVTIFPDPRARRESGVAGPWVPPKPGQPRLRLTDTCIDLPRLVHLINDSFGRKLDVEHYLNRVQDSLAGIIIAGEYEGGAILTWERPFGMDEETAYAEGRLVPYLDKFAVLRKSQGAGGVADIVFNAMVRDCFPGGVCWRSRKDNPVNKWYFERSRGVRKLPDSNWAMFWTSEQAALNERLMKDYEDVCRNVVPSWADNKAAD